MSLFPIGTIDPLAPLNLVNEARIIVKTNPIIFNVKSMETKEINPLENPFETKGLFSYPLIHRPLIHLPLFKF